MKQLLQILVIVLLMILGTCIPNILLTFVTGMWVGIIMRDMI